MFTKIKEKIKNEPVTFLFRKMWKFAEGHRKMVILFIFLGSFGNLLLLVEPYIFGRLLNEIQKNGVDENNIILLSFTIFSLLLVHFILWGFFGPGKVLQKKIAFIVNRKYREFLLTNVLKLNLSWHSGKDSGDSIDKINTAALGLRNFSRRVIKYMSIFVKIIGTTAILIFFNVYIGILVFFILILAFYIITKFDKNLIKKYKKLNLADNKISARVFDSIANISSVKILRIEKAVLIRFKKILWEPFSLYNLTSKIVETKWFIGQTFFTLIIVLPIFLYILYQYKNNLIVEIGTISAMYMYLSGLRSVFFNFGSLYEEAMVNKTSIQNAEEIEYAIPVIKNQKQKKEIPTWQTLKIKNLNFKYEDEEKEKNNLNNINLEIKRGERIAFIGQSGSGKTTFLKVIHGLYENTQAEICFQEKEKVTSNASDYQKTNFTNIDLKTMLVPQEPELFSSSIRENVTFGLDYTDQEILKVLKLANFIEVLNELPKGLDSIVNEKGVNLSGGQKQRLALARALLFSEEKEIILLDESTSSVDPNSEVKIYKNIFSKFSEKTFLASIHKMNLLKYFDRIIIFKNGEIADEGSFAELLERNEEFRVQWEEYVEMN